MGYLLIVICLIILPLSIYLRVKWIRKIFKSLEEHIREEKENEQIV